MTKTTLARHIKRFLVPNIKPLHSGFARFGQLQISREVCGVLTDPEAIANGLLDLQSKLDYAGSDLDEIIGNVLGEPFLLEDELTTTDFLDCLHPHRPLFDNGVSPVHGRYTHALQQYIIEHNLGKQKFADLLQLIRESPIVDCEHMEGRKWTLWDEFLDRPTPYTIQNCVGQSCREAILTGTRHAVQAPTCLDGRSPEWLTTVITLATPDCGIQCIHESISGDLSKRMEHVHQDIFITGFENLKYYQKLTQLRTEKSSDSVPKRNSTDWVVQSINSAKILLPAHNSRTPVIQNPVLIGLSHLGWDIGHIAYG